MATIARARASPNGGRHDPGDDDAEAQDREPRGDRDSDIAALPRKLFGGVEDPHGREDGGAQHEQAGGEADALESAPARGSGPQRSPARCRCRGGQLAPALAAALPVDWPDDAGEAPALPAAEVDDSPAVAAGVLPPWVLHVHGADWSRSLPVSVRVRNHQVPTARATKPKNREASALVVAEPGPPLKRTTTVTMSRKIEWPSPYLTLARARSATLVRREEPEDEVDGQPHSEEEAEEDERGPDDQGVDAESAGEPGRDPANHRLSEALAMPGRRRAS